MTETYTSTELSLTPDNVKMPEDGARKAVAIIIEEQIAWDNHRMKIINAFSKPLSETDPELWQRCVDKATQGLADAIDKEIVELYNANEHP